MPYALNESRMQRWQELFIDAEYEVLALPSYNVESASNPFRSFVSLPISARYKFMLDEAQFTIMSFIKGPVCRGKVALNVINDRFWVFFLDPDGYKSAVLKDFLASQEDNLELPASKENIYSPISTWRKYAEKQRALLNSFDQYLTEHSSDEGDISLEIVWDGNGTNDNAALTVFRHFDSATVEKGLVGEPPKTAWLIGYELLERIHYLLVAGYDIYGNIGHHLLSRTYMDFLRMEGETSFLLMLPPEARQRERSFWYREADDELMDFMTLESFESESVPSIEYTTDNEKLELFGKLKTRLAPVLPKRHSLESLGSNTARDALASLQTLVGESVTLMPQVTFLEIKTPDGSEHATLIRNDSYLNITSMFGDKKLRKPDEDTITVVNGFLGAYPNAFFVVDEAEVDQLAEKIASLRTEDDYARLLDDYGIRRTNPDFWQQSDRIHSSARETRGVEFGLYDYARFENR
jgi:hypothetical protein